MARNKPTKLTCCDCVLLIDLTTELKNDFSIGRAKRLADSTWLASRSQEEIWFGKWFSMLSYISFIENTILKTWNSFTIVFTLFTFLLSRDFTTQAESISPYPSPEKPLWRITHKFSVKALEK